MAPSSSSDQTPGSEFWNKLWAAVAISTSFAVLYGLFIALAIVSTYHLVRKGFRRSLSAIQLFAVTALFVSTTIHWAVVVLHRLSGLLHDPNDTAGAAHKITSLRPQCVGTATLTVNIVLSDLVVWWRVWVLWRDSRVLHRALAYICGGVLLSATFTTGVIDTRFSCKAQGGFMYEGLLVGSVASMLSLGTNLAATALTAYKAWIHRRCIRRHVASGSQNTQVESVFALLVESGALYCALWIVVVVWQIGSRNSDPQMRTSFFLSPTVLDKHTPDANSFWFKGGVLIEGCLVPLIAIYPTAIIVLVALNKSAVEHGFKPSDVVGPRSGIAVAVETVVSTRSDFEPEDSDLLPNTTGPHFGSDPGQALGGSEKMADAV